MYISLKVKYNDKNSANYFLKEEGGFGKIVELAGKERPELLKYFRYMQKG